MSRVLNIFISQPMHGLHTEEIHYRRMAIVEAVKVYVARRVPDISGVEVVNPIERDNVPKNARRLWFLGQAIADMEKADLVIFAEGYSSANGCLAERRVAELYCIPFIDERDLWH